MYPIYLQDGTTAFITPAESSPIQAEKDFSALVREQMGLDAERAYNDIMTGYADKLEDALLDVQMHKDGENKEIDGYMNTLRDVTELLNEVIDMVENSKRLNRVQLVKSLKHIKWMVDEF